MDTLLPNQRSKLMARIKAKNTKPEIVLRKLLHRDGFRFRLHRKDLPGRPDIVLPKYKSVIFVNGCFWHGHKDCKHFKIPKTRTDFWLNKIISNKKRDKKNIEILKKMGWNPITIWECTLPSKLPKQETEIFQSEFYRKVKNSIIEKF